MPEGVDTPPQYPAIPKPAQSFASLQQTCERLKEVTELLTGQRGAAEYSLVDGLMQIKKVSGNAVGSIKELNRLVVEDGKVVVERIEIIEAEIVAARAGEVDLHAKITKVETVSAEATDAVARDVETLETTVGENTASITSLTQSVDGMSVLYSMTGEIDGETGGFIFQGAQQNNGDVVFDMIFNANVTINGTLLVRDSVPTTAVAPRAISRVAANVGTIGATAGDTLSVTASFIGSTSTNTSVAMIMITLTPQQGPLWVLGNGAVTQRNYRVLADGVPIKSFYAYDTMTAFDANASVSGDTRYNFYFSGAGVSQGIIYPVATEGTHTLTLEAQTGGFIMDASISVTELAR